MKVSYFEETDSAYIRFGKGPAVDTVKLSEYVNADIAEDGSLIGMEIEYGAKKMLALNSVVIEQHAKDEVTA